MTPSPSSSSACRVLQLTDCHLLGDPQGRFLGIRPLETLDAVMAMALENRPPPDLVLLTGDLSQDGSDAAYGLVHERIADIGVPIGLLPGNHDRMETLIARFRQSNMQVGGSMRCGDWLVVLMDSTVRGKVGGGFDGCDLDELERQLSASSESPTLVCLHHQPVPIGTGWLDSLGLEQPEGFLAILDRQPQVCGVLWGHVHQEFDQQRHGVRLMATPSTSIQFKSNCEHFALDPIPPGCRWLTLHPDGRIETEVQRLATAPAGLDLHSIGY